MDELAKECLAAYVQQYGVSGVLEELASICEANAIECHQDEDMHEAYHWERDAGLVHHLAGKVSN